MLDFNEKTGNSGATHWMIGRGQLDLENLSLSPLSQAPLMAREMIAGDDVDFLADPFQLATRGGRFVLAEAWSRSAERGQIVAFELLADGMVGRREVVLAEAFHLSYPSIYEVDGEYYMLPEAWESGSLLLYKAIEFPWRWKRHREIAKLDYADPQMVEHEGHWYLFLNTDPLLNRSCSLYWASTFDGEWRLHPASPVIVDDPFYARSAGPLLQSNGRLIRFTQDCSRRYGASVYASEITLLTPQHFSMRRLGEVRLERPAWAMDRFHHLSITANARGYEALFDGSSASAQE